MDLTSLFVGLAIAAILGWTVVRTRRLWIQVQDGQTGKLQPAMGRRSTEIEISLRRMVFRRAQALHLAARLFPLDEILEPPRLLAPPPRIEPDAAIAAEDAVTLTVPYLPSWPELGATYRAPELRPEQALAGGARVAIIGQPGSGKTTTLAHLASMLANRSEALGALRDRIPFLIHVAELPLPIPDRKSLLKPFTEAAGSGVSIFNAAKVHRYVSSAFRDGRAILLIDGYDELTDAGQKLVTQFLRDIIQEFPRVGLVVTAAPEHLDGLFGLQLVPMTVAAWNHQTRASFIARWTTAWSRSIASEGTILGPRHGVDPQVVARWIGADHRFATPLEITLEAWAACAGDAQISGKLDAIAAHIRRLIPTGTPFEALEALATQVMLTAQPVFDPRKARAWIKEFELPEEAVTEPIASGVSATGTDDDVHVFRHPRPSLIGEATTPGLLGRLAASGLLMVISANQMRFVHPVFGGFLAGRGLRGFRAGDTLINQPDWIGKLLAMRYFAAHGDPSGLVGLLLNWSRLPAHRPLLTCGRWLQDAPPAAAWRARVLQSLAELVAMKALPLGLRAQGVVALALSADPSVAIAFRQMISSAAADVAQIAALGAGMLRDEKSVPALKGLLLSSSAATRRAACLALVEIGSSPAMEAVAEAMLGGDDILRRAAAEALANDRIEGHAILRDGAMMQDIPLRRAVAYGLGRIQEVWAMELLEKMRVEDDQWIVRNAASEMIENFAKAVDPRVPRPLGSPSETAWLVSFADTQGIGISAGIAATPALLAALKSPRADERLGSIEYLKRMVTEDVIRELYVVMLGDDPDLREAAFLAISEIGASGFSLPDPAKFGLN